MEELKGLQVQTPAQMRMEAMTNIEMPATWKVSAETKGLIRQSLEIYNTKHGMYSAIPMMCKGRGCPYATVCPILDGGANPQGERCPLEIGIVLKKFEDYCEFFRVDDHDVVDMGLVKDLVDYDVQLFRAENRIAMEGDFLEDVVITVTDSGQEITNKQISKAAEYKERIMNKKHKVLELMNSTRKDKAGDKLTVVLDPSTYASQLMSQVASSLKPGEIIDAEYNEFNLVDGYEVDGES